ncbi:MAG: metallophosphoesterase, partial [Flavisolibacter sp.]
MKFFFRLYLALFLFSGCTTTRNATGKKDDGIIEINFVQVNDVYEIAPLSGGREGGVARVATIKKKYLRQNPNSFLVIAGDFLSPSIYNSLQFQGKAIRGRQMIDALNVAGTDFACFGNHEFDIREQELLDRIDESKFQWVASNSFHKIRDSIRPFRRKNGEEIPRTLTINVEDADGTKARIGFIGICLPFNRAEYVYYVDALVAAKASYQQL